ncbi:hypothetical protein VTU32_03705 [Thermoanaerobacter sp. CM-CNRG TB177]|uniref:Uncharacterized protein n=1 Tax=Thermoanaerobacter pentosaceus TaxID=694059 RepID=A0ABT9M214_9THEO|nr:MULTISPECIES: hypothetical protein [Thermoanaerobacter]ABY93641.1 hypothetical protein Teth514_2381 [Thermoanaerobacter sp. X514]MBT1279375.1 hypothetical protein [Thermoanaerobacter sp. CM-CNRG TB177]MDP9750166.1 hypothetical protein [Thermoanaerobacter pentosaceus]
MKYKKIIFLIGLLWGLISFGLIEVAGRRGQFSMGNYLMDSKPFIAVVDIIRADNLVWLLKLLLLPYAVGLDLSIWTIGFIGCIFKYGNSSFQALGKVFVNYPIVEWFILIIYTILGGVILVILPYYLISYAVAKLLKI